MEALNHCPITRKLHRVELEKNKLLEKTDIPDDGKMFVINR